MGMHRDLATWRVHERKRSQSEDVTMDRAEFLAVGIPTRPTRIAGTALPEPVLRGLHEVTRNASVESVQ